MSPPPLAAVSRSCLRPGWLLSISLPIHPSSPFARVPPPDANRFAKSRAAPPPRDVPAPPPRASRHCPAIRRRRPSLHPHNTRIPLSPPEERKGLYYNLLTSPERNIEAESQQ